jgi:hypothetical protein
MHAGQNDALHFNRATHTIVLANREPGNKGCAMPRQCMRERHSVGRLVMTESAVKSTRALFQQATTSRTTSRGDGD